MAGEKNSGPENPDDVFGPVVLTPDEVVALRGSAARGGMTLEVSAGNDRAGERQRDLEARLKKYR